MVFTRTFHAKRERVWEAWTDPEILKMWWGPKGFTTPVYRLDLRVGGDYFSCMRSPDGKDYCSTGVFKEVVPLDRLVLTDSFADADGNVVPASHYGMPGEWPMETLVTVEFKEDGEITEIRMVSSGSPEGMASEMARAGWNESFDKLEEYLEKGSVSVPRTTLIANPGVQEIIIKRTFDAPRELVFKAFTDDMLVPMWWGPAKYRTTIDKLEARDGGSWRFVQHDDDGNEFAFRGVFHEVKAPEKIIQTFEYEPMHGHVELQIARFEEREGKTHFCAKSVYLSVKDRDGELSAGMEAGMNEGYERLDALLERM